MDKDFKKMVLDGCSKEEILEKYQKEQEKKNQQFAADLDKAMTEAAAAASHKEKVDEAIDNLISALKTYLALHDLEWTTEDWHELKTLLAKPTGWNIALKWWLP